MKKLLAFVIALAMVLSLAMPALAETKNANHAATSTVPKVRDAATVDEALNVEGGSLVFTNDATYPWVVDGDAAKSGNAGLSSTTSAISTTVTAVEGDIVQFDFKAWGEGTYSFWDHCDFAVDGNVVFTKGAYDNSEWESFSYGLSAGEHELTWSYTKDSSVNPTGDYFMVDSVYVGQPAVATSIVVQPVEVPSGRRATVSYEVLPEAAFDKSVTFEIADETIATVDANGVVTGVAEGTTTITVTSVADTTVSGTAAVTVTEALPAVTLYGYATYDMGGNYDSEWVEFPDYDPADYTGHGGMEKENAWAAAFAGGTVYGYIYDENNNDYSFFIMDPETYDVSFTGANASAVGGMLGMSYDYSTDTMYGISGGSSTRYLCTIDLATGYPTAVAAITGMVNSPMTFAVDMNGVGYAIEISSGDLYTIDLETAAATRVGSTGAACSYVQSMCFDYETGQLFWAQISSADDHGLYLVNTETGAAIFMGTIGTEGCEVTGLYTKNDIEIAPIEIPDATVTFVDGVDDSVLDTWTVEAGTVLDEDDFPEPPEHEGWVFDHWDYNGSAIYADTTITAVYSDPTATIWDFETDPAAQGFIFLDEDGDGYNWMWTYNSSGIVHHEGDGCAQSASYVNYVGALTPDNWMITPEFDNTNLSFWAQGQDSSYASEYLGVFVSADGGETWSNEIAHFVLTGSDTEYKVDLSEYDGPIKAAIRHYNVTDMYYANVDYITVYGASSEPPVTEPPVSNIIDEVHINGFVEPAWGEHPVFDLTVPDDANYSISETHWYSYSRAELTEDDVFDDPNVQYYMYIAVAPDEGYEWGEDCDVYLNDSYSYVFFSGYEDNGCIFVYSNYFTVEEPFETEPPETEPPETEPPETEPPVSNVIDTIEIEGFTVPAWGEHPDFELSVPEGAPYHIEYLEWNWYDNYDGSSMEDDDYFDDSEVNYYMYFEVYPNDGYTISEDATVTINGSTEYVDPPYSGYDSEIECYYVTTIDFTIEAPFETEPPVELIDTIEINDFVVPAWGEHPFFDVTIPDDAGYELTYVMWKYYTPGITGTGGDMTANDVFDDPTVAYYQCFRAVPLEGYEFAEEVTVLINGSEEYVIEDWTYLTEDYYRIETIDFFVEEPVEPELISTIELNGFVVPEWGANPNYAVTVPEDAHYSKIQGLWYRYNTSAPMNPDDTFNDPNEQYYMYFFLVPMQGYAFADDVTVLINGSTEYVFYATPDNGGISVYTEFFTVHETDLIVIDTIEVNDFVVPAWGEHPVFDFTVPEGAGYEISDVDWITNNAGHYLTADDVFDDPDDSYFCSISFSVLEGYTFAATPIYLIDGSDEYIWSANHGVGYYDGIEFAYIITNDFAVEEPPEDPYAIHEVWVDGFGTPVAYVAGIDHVFLTTPDDAPYFIIYGGWRDETDQQQMWSDEHVFIPGHYYSEGCQIWADEGYYFAEDCVFYANGGTELIDTTCTYVDEIDNWICYINILPVLCESTAPTLGDVDLDGEVTVADALLAMRYAMGVMELTEEQLAQMDVNGDGVYDLVDATLILRYAMGIITDFPYPMPD